MLLCVYCASLNDPDRAIQIRSLNSLPPAIGGRAEGKPRGDLESNPEWERDRSDYEMIKK